MTSCFFKGVSLRADQPIGPVDARAGAAFGVAVLRPFGMIHCPEGARDVSPGRSPGLSGPPNFLFFPRARGDAPPPIGFPRPFGAMRCHGMFGPFGMIRCPEGARDVSPGRSPGLSAPPNFLFSPRARADAPPPIGFPRPFGAMRCHGILRPSGAVKWGTALKPRALPWAGILRPFGAMRCPEILRPYGAIRRHGNLWPYGAMRRHGMFGPFGMIRCPEGARDVSPGRSPGLSAPPNFLFSPRARADAPPPIGFPRPFGAMRCHGILRPSGAVKWGTALKPRALPWAGILRPFGAMRCPEILRPYGAIRRHGNLWPLRGDAPPRNVWPLWDDSLPRRGAGCQPGAKPRVIGAPKFFIFPTCPRRCTTAHWISSPLRGNPPPRNVWPFGMIRCPEGARDLSPGRSPGLPAPPNFLFSPRARGDPPPPIGFPRPYGAIRLPGMFGPFGMIRCPEGARDVSPGRSPGLSGPPNFLFFPRARADAPPPIGFPRPYGAMRCHGILRPFGAVKWG